MDALLNFDLKTICRTCTSSLIDTECYAIDTDLEEMITVLTSIKFDHIENKDNLRMCINCYDCLKSFNDFRANCINIHEKLTRLDLTEKISEDDVTEGYLIEEITETGDEIIEYNEDETGSDDEEAIKSIIKAENEVVLAVEKIVESEEQEEVAVPKAPAKKSNVKKSEASGERGKEIYQRLLKKCTICGKMVEKNRFEGHINKHNNIRPYSCPECKKEFHCKQLMRLHRTTLHTNFKVKCETCDKFFPSSRALYAHNLRHRNENRYVCELCDKKFNNSNSLKRHMAIHSGVREFVCTQCGVGFYRKFNLDVHIKNVHDQKKEFLCTFEDCKKSFGYARLLKDHVKKCHNNIKLENYEY